MQLQVRQMLDKLTHLSPERLAEVDDFIDFIYQREQDSRLRQQLSGGSEVAFNKIWDNDADAIYDTL